MRESTVTPVRLSEWMRRSGALPRGAVADLHVDLELETSISKLVFVTARYSADTPCDLPRRLVVKSPLSRSTGTGDGEGQFYRQLAPALGTPPLARCVAVVEDGDPDAGTVVLEDLRAAYDHPPWPVPPSRRQSETAVAALARVHA